MAKSPEAFRTISEVADWLGTPAHVLRFWESRFNQVKPVKRAGGRRYYRPADMQLLGGIRQLLHDDGITIKGVQKILRERGIRYVAGLAPELEFDAAEAEAAPAPAEPFEELVQPDRAAETAGEYEDLLEAGDDGFYARPAARAETAIRAAARPVEDLTPEAFEDAAPDPRPEPESTPDPAARITGTPAPAAEPPAAPEPAPAAAPVPAFIAAPLPADPAQRRRALFDRLVALRDRIQADLDAREMR